MKIVFLVPANRYDENFLKKLQAMDLDLTLCTGNHTEAEVMAACREAEYIITVAGIYKFPAELLEKLPACRFIQTLSIGYNGIDVKAASELGIGVINVATFCVEEIAEHAMALLLGCSRWVTALHNRVKRGQAISPTSDEATRHLRILRGKTLGLIGFGNSGRLMVPKARGFGMNILAHDPFIEEGIFAEYQVKPVSLESLLAESDYVSLHVNLTEENRHLMGLEQFKRMKPTAYIVNVSRGALIDEKALCTALREGYIAGAGLDVTETEPLPTDSPLHEFEEVVITGHLAGVSPEAKEAMATIPVEELQRVMRHQWPVNLVNPPVKAAYERKWGGMAESG